MSNKNQESGGLSPSGLFRGLSAFPLTPMDEAGLDLEAFARLLRPLTEAGVDSLGVLGSTGCYPYLTRTERAQVLRAALEWAGSTPVIAGIGDLRTRDVLQLAEDAQKLGVAGVLLAPVSYQKLSEDEVFGLYEAVTRELSVPLCVYDNPATTGFEFSDALHGRIAHLPQVGSIKIPPVPLQPADAARERVRRLRALIPAHVTMGISGDGSAAAGLHAGCEVWYSVFGGLFPQQALELTRHALDGRVHEAQAVCDRLAPLWALYGRFGGSLRVMATAAEWKGVVRSPCLPQPLQTLQGRDREEVRQCLLALGLL